MDFHAGEVRLDPRHSKHKTSCLFPFSELPPLVAVLREQRERTTTVERATGTLCEWVFHRNGRPIKDYRGAWKLACRDAGLPGKLPHDFRRTAGRLSAQLAADSAAVSESGTKVVPTADLSPARLTQRGAGSAP